MQLHAVFYCNLLLPCNFSSRVSPLLCLAMTPAKRLSQTLHARRNIHLLHPSKQNSSLGRILTITKKSRLHLHHNHIMSRPELTGHASLFYNAKEARKYDSSSRMVGIQREITERAIELLKLPQGGRPSLILDVGCGSGLSGQVGVFAFLSSTRKIGIARYCDGACYIFLASELLIFPPLC